MKAQRKLTIREKHLFNTLSQLRSNYEEVLSNLKNAMKDERYEIVPDIEKALTSIRNDIKMVRDRLEVIQTTKKKEKGR